MFYMPDVRKGKGRRERDLISSATSTRERRIGDVVTLGNRARDLHRPEAVEGNDLLVYGQKSVTAGEGIGKPGVDPAEVFPPRKGLQREFGERGKIPKLLLGMSGAQRDQKGNNEGAKKGGKK